MSTGDILTTNSYCAQCGSPLRPGARFCSSCGCGTAQAAPPEPIVSPPQEFKHELTQAEPIPRLKPRKKHSAEANKPKTTGRSRFRILRSVLGGVGGVALVVLIQSIMDWKIDNDSGLTYRVSNKSSYIPVTPSEMVTDFSGNPVVADAKYKGKQIKITGTVTGFDKAAGTSYVVLDSGHPQWRVGVSFLANKQLSKAAKLHIGQRITVLSPISLKQYHSDGRWLSGYNIFCNNCGFDE